MPHGRDPSSVFERHRRRIGIQLIGCGSAGPSIGSTIDALDNQLVSPGADKQLATPWYSDQVLPFDITLSGANEYGAMCAAKIFGVEILNEGWGISIDDAVSEMQATFVARVVEPMSACGKPVPDQVFLSFACPWNH